MTSSSNWSAQETPSTESLTPWKAPETIHAFDLPNFVPAVPVVFAPDLPVERHRLKKLLSEYKPFIEWYQQIKLSLACQKAPSGAADEIEPDVQKDFDPYALKEVHIQAVDMFGPRIGFLKFVARIENERGNKGKPMRLPGAIFMRGGSVGMLMILKPKNAEKDEHDTRWVIMTEQARIPVGSLSFLEIPAGMIDDQTHDFKGVAAKEIEEETGLVINRDDLVDMTKLALAGPENEEKLQAAMYPSPGGSDEFIALFLWEQEMERLEIEALREKLTGNKQQGEMITLRLIPYEKLWQVAARDAKTMVAWALYESLKRAGLLDDNGNELSVADTATH